MLRAFRRCVIRDTYLRARAFIRPHENDKCTCMHTVYTRGTYHRRVALCETIEATDRPTSQPTGFIITRWHRAIRAARSLTSVKHVGIIARTRGSFNISISAVASYYPRKSRRRPARMKTLHESAKPPKRPNFACNYDRERRGRVVACDTSKIAPPSFNSYRMSRRHRRVIIQPGGGTLSLSQSPSASSGFTRYCRFLRTSVYAQSYADGENGSSNMVSRLAKNS